MKTLLILILCGFVLLFLFGCATAGTAGFTPAQAVQVVKSYLNLQETSSSTQTNRILFYVKEVVNGDKIKPDDPFSTQPELTVTGNGYFFMVDKDPLGRFSHSVQYIVISKSDGSVLLESDALWTPAVNNLPQLTGDIYAAGFTGNVWQNFPDHTLTTERVKHAENRFTLRDGGEVEGSIVVNGNDPDRYPDVGISTDAENMDDFYEGFSAMSETMKLSPPDNTEDDLIGAIQYMADAGVNDVSLYIVTHGDSDVLVMGESTMTASELSTILAGYPSITFKVIIDACKSGSFVDDLSALSNVAIVVTATDSENSSYGDIDGPSDPNPEDTGGEWTSGFLEDLEEYSTPSNWEAILELASFLGISPKVILYSDSFDSAWLKDYARILGLSTPQRYSPDY